MIAALIAVVGALIAFAGVWRTTGTTRRENRRAENVAVLMESAAAIQDLTRAVDRVARTQDAAARAALVTEMDAGPMKELGDKFTMAATRLELYGFDDAARETNALEDKLIAAWDSLRQNPTHAVDLQPCHQDFNAALTAIKEARRRLR